ncbi:MAG: helix-turn-helix domain-containing protein [Bacteroidota bacterium]
MENSNQNFEICKKVCRAIREKRMIKGFSQEYMAIQLDVTQKTYGKLENCNSPLSIQRLLQIAEILEIDLRSVFSFFNRKPIRAKGEPEFMTEGYLPGKIIYRLEKENAYLRTLVLKNSVDVF